LYALHRELLRIRVELMPLLRAADFRVDTDCHPATALLQVHYSGAGRAATLILAFGTAVLDTTTPPGAEWRIRMDTAAEMWGGPGRLEPDLLRADALLEIAPHSAVLLVRAEGGQ
ncbi:MAG: DUF3459 domain-containing protein, partial [bacterium]